MNENFIYDLFNSHFDSLIHKLSIFFCEIYKFMNYFRNTNIANVYICNHKFFEIVKMYKKSNVCDTLAHSPNSDVDSFTIPTAAEWNEI